MGCQEAKVGAMKKIWDIILDIEMCVVHNFNTWCQSPHWLFFWIIYFIVWTIWRQFGNHSWYNSDLDLLVITWTSAIITGLVEYSMKVTQGIQMAQQQKQMEMLEDQIELLIKLSESNIALQKKLLSEVEEISDDIDHINEGNI